MRRITFALLMLVMGVGTGCSISSVASDPRGIKGVDGDHLTHINTRNYAVHLFMTKPFWREPAQDWMQSGSRALREDIESVKMSCSARESSSPNAKPMRIV